MNNQYEQNGTADLLKTIEDLSYRLQIAEDTIEAIRTGSVDALAVQENGETKIFTLEGAEQTYRVLVESMSEGAVTLNQQGLVLYCNSQFAQLINLPLNEVIGSSFYRFIPAEYHLPFSKIFITGWKQQTKSEFILQPAGAAIVHVYISLTTIANKGEEVLGMIITNLSDQKELEKLTKTKEELSVKNDELLKINYDLDTFVYTASHDLKSPVLNIEGLVMALDEILAEDPQKKEVYKIIHLINNSIARFKNTILDLTEISKLQKNFSSLPEKINCREIIQEVIAGLQDQIVKAQAEITVDIVDFREFEFSKKNFQSIIYNLLSNAIKYCCADRKPKILVKIEPHENFVLLSVQDNGLGIQVSQMPKMFSMFGRLHDHVEGSGIGLYIVKRIMDNAGGNIELESEEGLGSTFKLYFKI